MVAQTLASFMHNVAAAAGLHIFCLHPSRTARREAQHCWELECGQADTGGGEGQEEQEQIQLSPVHTCEGTGGGAVSAGSGQCERECNR